MLQGGTMSLPLQEDYQGEGLSLRLEHGEPCRPVGKRMVNCAIAWYV